MVRPPDLLLHSRPNHGRFLHYITLEDDRQPRKSVRRTPVYLSSSCTPSPTPSITATDDRRDLDWHVHARIRVQWRAHSHSQTRIQWSWQPHPGAPRRPPNRAHVRLARPLPGPAARGRAQGRQRGRGRRCGQGAQARQLHVLRHHQRQLCVHQAPSRGCCAYPAVVVRDGGRRAC